MNSEERLMRVVESSTKEFTMVSKKKDKELENKFLSSGEIE